MQICICRGMKLKISELGKVITGNTPSKKIKEFWDKDDVGFVKPDIISDEHIVKIKSEDCNEFISNAAISKARIVPKNSIFVTCIGNIGKIGVATENLAFNQQINAIIPNENVNLDYLCYAIFANKTRLQDIANAPIVPLLNKSQFSEFELEFDMDINTQTRIVHELNTVSNIILKYKQELLLLDELVRARFMEMFGDPMINPYEWKVINISEVLRAKASNGFFSRRDDYCDDGNVEVLGVANVVNRMYSQVVDLPRTNANEKDIEKFEVKYGDMLFCRSSLVAEGIGKASIIPEGVQTNILFECHVIRLPLDLDKCVPEFLQTLSTTKFFRNQIISKSKTATMTTIGQDGILKTNIILPPLEKQKEYYNFVKQIDKSRSRIQKSLEASQELFDSLMQEYFG